MRKEDFLKTLNPQQRSAVEFFLDEAFALGYSRGQMDSQFVDTYKNGKYANNKRF